jgi:hypothetical protein
MSKAIVLKDDKGRIIKSEIVQDKDLEETKKSFESDKKNLTNQGKNSTIKVLGKITG